MRWAASHQSRVGLELKIHVLEIESEDGEVSHHFLCNDAILHERLGTEEQSSCGRLEFCGPRCGGADVCALQLGAVSQHGGEELQELTKQKQNGVVKKKRRGESRMTG